MRVAALAVYPVKGAAAVPLERVALDNMGPLGDRRYCLARPSGRVFTQRDDASLARLRAQPHDGGLLLEFDGERLQVGAADFATAAQLHVWSRQTAARIARNALNAALTRWFGTPLQLARLERPVERQGAMLAFGDAAALLLTNAASLDALNASMDVAVPMARFRPNIVLAGAAAFDEDRWQRLRVGSAILAPVHACGRCEVTTIDQEVGAVVDGEPLRTLSRLRMRDGEPVFGVRYAVAQPGDIRVGDRAFDAP
ncbi:MAG TPA: MOSC domain-containing protein [Burkholderiales bacterium]|nr:MOSC domain-containing protein [Burkholderiales bacterium]